MVNESERQNFENYMRGLRNFWLQWNEKLNCYYSDRAQEMFEVWLARASESSPPQPECAMEGCDLVARYCVIHGAAAPAPAPAALTICPICDRGVDRICDVLAVQIGTEWYHKPCSRFAPTATDWRIDMLPDCSVCGKPSPLGNKCEPCKAAEMRGYKMETDDVSGSKQFTDWATHHFCSGYQAACKDILRERMKLPGSTPGP